MRTDSAGMFPLSGTIMDVEFAKFFFPLVVMKYVSLICSFDMFL